jgi:cytochrome c oxidase cbb3-type subunit II
MNRFRLIFTGFLLTFFSSWVGLVLLPVITVGDFKQTVDPATGAKMPPDLTALERRGQKVYIANGCVYCHTQQVRPERSGTDIARGWGSRRTIAEDYMTQGRILLGTMRTGPDLSNIGTRNPSEVWHLMHLYNPQTTSKGSNMAPFPFLFTTRKIQGTKAPEALNLPAEFAPPEGMEIVPTEDAKALVAYLQSLKFSSNTGPAATRAKIESKAEATPR